MPLSYNELMKLLRQLPNDDEGDVFRMHDMEMPRNDYCYTGHIQPSAVNTITVSLEKSKYMNVHLARERAAKVFELRGLKPYKAFQTARCWCWYTTKVA